MRALACLCAVQCVAGSEVSNWRLRRGLRAGYRRANDPTAAQLVERSDDRNVRRILVRGVNAPLPPDAKKILKI